MEVKKKILVGHIGDLKHKSSEVIDVIADATYLLESTKARSRFILHITWGKLLLEFMLEMCPYINGAYAFSHFIILYLPS